MSKSSPMKRIKRRALRAVKETFETPWNLPKYCWFSATHKAKMVASRAKYREVFYQLLDGTVVEITEVFTDPNRKPTYDDAVCIGQGHYHDLQAV